MLKDNDHLIWDLKQIFKARKSHNVNDDLNQRALDTPLIQTKKIWLILWIYLGEHSDGFFLPAPKGKHEINWTCAYFTLSLYFVGMIPCTTCSLALYGVTLTQMVTINISFFSLNCSLGDSVPLLLTSIQVYLLCCVAVQYWMLCWFGVLFYWWLIRVMFPAFVLWTFS